MQSFFRHHPVSAGQLLGTLVFASVVAFGVAVAPLPTAVPARDACAAVELPSDVSFERATATYGTWTDANDVLLGYSAQEDEPVVRFLSCLP